MGEKSFFEKNVIVSYAIILASLLFIAVVAIEKTKVVFKMIPMVRGEVTLKDFVITTMKDGSPIIIKKDYPKIAEQLRISGKVVTEFSQAISSFYKKNSIIIEVGPNFGYNTIPLARSLDENGKLYAFEANTRVCSILRKNLVLNDLDQKVVIKNVAISDHAGMCKVPDCISVNEISEGIYSSPRVMSVKCNTLDDELDLEEETRPISLISIDIPEMEIRILRSCEKIIERSPDIIIIMAMTPLTDPDKISEAKNELKKLEDLGMTFYEISKEHSLVKTSLKDLQYNKESILVITRRESPLD